MSRGTYTQAGHVVTVGRDDALGVHLFKNGTCVHSGALVNEEQSLDEYMDMLGFKPVQPQSMPITEPAATTTVTLDVDGRVANTSGQPHWSTQLAEAMQELAMAKEANLKAAARLATATAAFERAKSNAENSILGE